MDIILAAFGAILTLILGLKIAKSGEKPEHVDLWSILKNSDPSLEPVRVTPSSVQLKSMTGRITGQQKRRR